MFSQVVGTAINSRVPPTAARTTTSSPHRRPRTPSGCASRTCSRSSSRTRSTSSTPCDYLGTKAAAEGKTICVVIQNDAYGEAGLEGAGVRRASVGFEIGPSREVQARRHGLHRPGDRAADTECEIVFATALPTEFAGILGTAAGSGFAPQWIGPVAGMGRRAAAAQHSVTTSRHTCGSLRSAASGATPPPRT